MRKQRGARYGCPLPAGLHDAGSGSGLHPLPAPGELHAPQGHGARLRVLAVVRLVEEVVRGSRVRIPMHDSQKRSWLKLFLCFCSCELREVSQVCSSSRSRGRREVVRRVHAEALEGPRPRREADHRTPQHLCVTRNDSARNAAKNKNVEKPFLLRCIPYTSYSVCLAVFALATRQGSQMPSLSQSFPRSARQKMSG